MAIFGKIKPERKHFTSVFSLSLISRDSWKTVTLTSDANVIKATTACNTISDSSLIVSSLLSESKLFSLCFVFLFFYISRPFFSWKKAMACGVHFIVHYRAEWNGSEDYFNLEETVLACCISKMVWPTLWRLPFGLTSRVRPLDSPDEKEPIHSSPLIIFFSDILKLGNHHLTNFPLPRSSICPFGLCLNQNAGIMVGRKCQT